MDLRDIVGSHMIPHCVDFFEGNVSYDVSPELVEGILLTGSHRDEVKEVARLMISDSRIRELRDTRGKGIVKVKNPFRAYNGHWYEIDVSHYIEMIGKNNDYNDSE